MNTKPTRALRNTLAGLSLALALAATAAAQQPAPSPRATAGAKADTGAAPQTAAVESDFKITSSVEVGVRGLRVVGDLNKYQSDLNYKAGPRVFDSSFLVETRDGAGAPFDSLLVTSTGWGSDPHGHARFSVEKTKWYRFDGSYRRFKYFRFLNNFANPNYAPPSRQTNPVTGQHGSDTRQQVGDFDLTVLPKNEKIRFNFGYSPTRYRGPAFTHYRGGGDEFPVLSRIDTRANDFRLGADWKLGPLDFSFMQGFRRFTDETFIPNQGALVGNNPTAANATLTSLERTNPVKGKVDYTRFSAHTLVARRLDLTGRFIYSTATNDFNFLDVFAGTNYNTRITGIPATYNPPNTVVGRQSFVGDTKRPQALGDLAATFLVTDRLRISNTFRVETFQISGGAFYTSLFNVTRPNGTALAPLTPSGTSYDLTKFRRFQNTVEADYEFSEKYTARFGYRYGTRRIERFVSGANLASNAAPLLTPEHEEEENHTHVFTGGVRARPVKGWTLSFNVDRGTADNIFTRFGNYNYTNFKARSRYAVSRTLSFNLGLVTRDNSNPTEIDGVSLADFGVQIKSRIFTSSFDWQASPRLSFGAGYNHNRVDSDAVIEYAFLSTQNAAIRGRSLYFQRNHFFHFDAVAQPFRRVSLYATYRVNKDTGQGDRVSNPAGALLISSYPMSYQSPEARVAVRINRRLDWNVGYSYYNYEESTLAAGNFVPNHRPQNYHAHLPYTSLRFYFGGGDR